MNKIIDGKKISEKLLSECKSLIEKKELRLKLAVVLVGDNTASKVYVKMKEQACERVGIGFELIKLADNVSGSELLELIDSLNKNEEITGFIVQLPLPDYLKHFQKEVIEKIDPNKDIDGFHSKNLGRAIAGDEFLAPATPTGIIKLLEEYKVSIEGQNVVVVGRSNIVGKPVANMLINRGGTVTVCHSKTKDLKSYTKSADLLVVATGVGKLIKKDMVKKGVVVVDVGVNRLEDGSLCGDVDFDEVLEKVSLITPVPGGVGPMTVASLIYNLVKVGSGFGKIYTNEL